MKYMIDIIKYKKIILMLGFIWVQPLFGAVSPADKNMITEQQKLILEEAQQQRESLQQSFNIQSTMGENLNDSSTICFTIVQIDFKGVEHLTKQQQQKLTQPYLNQCLSIEKIKLLVKSVTNYYIGKGFITTNAYLDEQDISSGVLIISVLEGKVDEIYLDGQSPTILNMVLPNLKGQVLNLRDIEQGVEQINRLQSKQVSIDIEPSSREGFSVIMLKSRKKRDIPLVLNLGINNDGQKSTGVWQNSVGLSLDNPLQLADLWRFSFSSNNDLRHNHGSRNFSGQISIPYGYWTFDYLYSTNYFYYDIPLVFDKWRYKGKNQLQRLMVNRLLYRDSETKLTLTSNFTAKKNKNTVAGETIIISSPTLNILSAGINYTTILNRGYLTFNPAISQGLHILNTTPDRQYFDGVPKSQFTKLTLSSSYYKPLTQSIYYLTSFYGQWSKQNLYATERISVGGEYSVRGFKESSITGNKGFYWRNELTYQTSLNAVMQTLSITAAVDTGWIKPKHNQIDGGNMTGAAVSLNLSDNHYYNTALTIGKPLFHPEKVNPDHWVSYFQFTLNF